MAAALWRPGTLGESGSWRDIASVSAGQRAASLEKVENQAIHDTRMLKLRRMTALRNHDQLIVGQPFDRFADNIGIDDTIFAPANHQCGAVDERQLLADAVAF